MRKIEEVIAEVHRYKKQQISWLIEDIKRDIQNSKGKSTYLISFIPKKQEYKLPNITITSITELEEFYQKYLQIDNAKYTEIWYFKKFENKSFNNLIGRIRIYNKDLYDDVSDLQRAQIIEQVWSPNHREIEKYNENIKAIFLSASRSGWTRKYNIDKLIIPEGTNVQRDEILRQFSEITREIELRRENVESFLEYIKDLDIKNLSLEYMIKEGKFSFIDWDSENDFKVINNLIKIEQ